MNAAVIDLGTNTFNLLVAKKNDESSFSILHSSKIAVMLAKGLNNKRELKPDAITRGLNAIQKFHQVCKEFNAEKIYAFATSAIRSAKNGNVFVNTVKERFNIDVSIIEGEREAELIYFGVRRAVEINRKVLVLDIGGGSNEFIIADKRQIYWKKSYPMGVAYMLEKFKPSDPLSIEEIEIITNFFEGKLADLFIEVNKHQVDTLIGASGTFESFAAMLREEKRFESEVGMESQAISIDMQDFEELSWRLLNSTVKERKKMAGLEALRLDFIVLATMFVKFVLDKAKIQNFIQSNFALKEGIMCEVMDNMDR